MKHVSFLASELLSANKSAANKLMACQMRRKSKLLTRKRHAHFRFAKIYKNT